MNVPNEDLDKWRRMAMEARNRAMDASFALERGRADEARGPIETVYDLAAQLVERMDLAGAEPSHPLPSRQIPLHLLDTPASRAYLAALIEARRAAIEMDAERYSRGEAECCDTPSACAVDLMVCGMEMDIFGVSEAPYAKGAE